MEKTRALMMLLLIGLLVVACDNPAEEASPESEDAEEFATPTATATLVAPTNTQVPTSTPSTPTTTPTVTYTLPPSDTPSPPDTPTPTASPTPQQVGRVITETRANVRGGAGTDFDIVAVLNPGDEVVVVGPGTEEETEGWLEIVLDNGETGWILSTLLRVEERQVAPMEAAAADATPTIGVTSIPGNAVYVLANCDEFDRGRQTVTAGRPVVVYWGWVASTRQQIEEHVAHVNYEITLNDRPLGNWRQATIRDMTEAGKPARYWYEWVGDLPVGTYRVGYRVTWDAPVNDGDEDFGPGTANSTVEFGCTFEVR